MLLQKKITESDVNIIKQEWLDEVVVVSDRKFVLQKLPKAGCVAEVGVGYGPFSREILRALEPQKFIAIDLFNGTAKDRWGKPLAESGLTHLAYYKAQLVDYLHEAELICKEGNSWEQLALFEDSYFDYVYVDADHAYSSVKQDIEVAKRKVKVGGYIQCNDFTFFDTHNMVHYGVPRAVFELLEEENYKMKYLCLQNQGYYDVVLQRVN